MGDQNRVCYEAVEMVHTSRDSGVSQPRGSRPLEKSAWLGGLLAGLVPALVYKLVGGFLPSKHS
jgi:hypothetical protein